MKRNLLGLILLVTIFSPVICTTGADPLPVITQLTYSTYHDKHSSWTFEKIVLYDSFIDSWYRVIMKLDLNTSTIEQITNRTDVVDECPDMSPDGSEIVFQRWGLRGDYHDIMIMNSDGSGVRSLTYGSPPGQPQGCLVNPVWSHNGTKIMFRFFPYTSSGGSLNYIYVMDKDGTNMKLLTEGWNPRWNHDDSMIIYWKRIDNLPYVCTYNLTSQQINIITVGDVPDISMTGKLVYHFEGDIYTININGSNKTLIINNGDYPRWSPDGKSVVFEDSSRTGNLDIFLYEPQTGNNETEIDDWPMFRHDPIHSGYSLDSAPSTNDILWLQETGDYIDYSSPAVVDGRVYIGSHYGGLYCMDAFLGDVLWQYTPSSEITSSPAVYEGRVYFGTNDGQVHCIDAYTKEHIWSNQTGDYVHSSPTVLDGYLYVGSYDGKVYCFNAITGHEEWNYTTGDKVGSSPAVISETVYVGSHDGSLYCLNASNGDLIWSKYLGGRVSSSPSINEGKIYVGSYLDEVHCLDASTGSIAWHTPISAYSSPAVAYGNVYIGGINGKVYCLNSESGAVKWSYQTGTRIYSSPAVADNKVYIGSIDYYVHCLDAHSGTVNGEPIWKYYTGINVESSPAVAYGNVYVASLFGDVYCFGIQRNNPPIADTGGPYVANEGVIITFNASATTDPDGDTLQYRWDFENDGIWDTDWSDNPTATNYWPDDWTGSVKVEVFDGQISSTATASITIYNINPEVDSGTPQTVDEGSIINYTGNYVDTPADTHTIVWDFGDGSSTVGGTLSPTHVYGDNGVYTVILTITDDDGGVGSDTVLITVKNVDPIVSEIFATIDPVQVESLVLASASFTDKGYLDTHTASWDWGDYTTSVGLVDEINGTGTVHGEHVYDISGVYTVILTVTDDDGGNGTSVLQYIVVYDPEGSFVTGGGWIDSPEGAYPAEPSLTGKATFGFVSKYKKGASEPTGNTEFVFHVADLNFHSNDYDWLVIAGNKAKYKGTGAINGDGEYSFMLTATDGDLMDTYDTFRIKIWDKATDTSVYDNKMDESYDSYEGTELGGGNIKIHECKN